MNKKLFLSAIVIATLSTSGYTQCTDHGIDTKQQLFVTGYSLLGLYSTLEALQSAASYFVIADYVEQTGRDTNSILANQISHIIKTMVFGAASVLSFIQAYRLYTLKPIEKPQKEKDLAPTTAHKGDKE